MRTPGYYALALYAQGDTPATGPGEVNTDIIYLVLHASLIAQVVLAILLLFSAIAGGGSASSVQDPDRSHFRRNTCSSRT